MNTIVAPALPRPIPVGAEMATLADNYGHAEVRCGRIDGDRLIFETIGAPVPLRLTWDASDPAAIS